MAQQGLMDLANKIDALVRKHPAYAEAHEITKGCSDHLRLLSSFNTQAKILAEIRKKE